MVIPSAALLAACFPARIAVGASIATLISVMANGGGVGIAMLFLSPPRHFLQKRPPSEGVRHAAG